MRVAKKRSVMKRLKRLRRFRGRMPQDYRFTRADAYERRERNPFTM